MIKISRNRNKVSGTTHFLVYSEITLMVLMSISFSYIMHENLNTRPGDIISYSSKQIDYLSTFLNVVKLVGSSIFGDDFVSAVEINNTLVDTIDSYLTAYDGTTTAVTNVTKLDMEQGVYTCPTNKFGSTCQEYTASQCATNCAVPCLPTSADKTSVCKIGTCYDKNEGSCQSGATKTLCENNGGQWFNDTFANVAQCKPGCCIMGSNAYFGTEQECTHDAATLGIKKDFHPEIKDSLTCLSKVQQQREGACVFTNNDGGKNNCKFTTELNCVQNLNGKFNYNALCSNPSLNTICEKQASIGCIEGKDEVYWKDSCGNRENIYDVNKDASWNAGIVLSKNSSCSLISGNNYLANKNTCGNCNRLLGSVCGLKNNSTLVGTKSEYICKDLSCTDENGNKRKNGESWCQYQSSTGPDKGSGGFLRSSDTVGSRNFRKACVDGEVRTEPCADYRNEICTESKNTIPGGKISTAACRISLGYSCYTYNKEGMKDKCEQNPDCFIKHVEIQDSFKFDICAPKNAPGFDLETRGEGANAFCSIANQKCTVVYVKGLSGWKCVANCNCEKPAFAEQMNDLCISLGDCGTKTNFLGDLSINHKVFKSTNDKKLGKEVTNSKPKLSTTYISELNKYSNKNNYRNDFINASDISKIAGELGIPGWLGSATNPEDSTSGIRGMIGQIAGMAGIGLAVAAYVVGTGTLAAFAASVAGQSLTVSQTISAGAAAAPGLGAAMGVTAGAALGLAVVSLLLDFTGVGRGLPPAVTYLLMGAGTVAGAIIGYNAIGSTALGTVAPTLLAIAWIVIIVVVVVIIIFAALGIGKTKKYFYNFQCNPWQAPLGGAKCELCGKTNCDINGKNCLPCSKYSCNSLGQTCQLINEDSSPSCVNIAKNDTSPPVLTPMAGILPENYKIETFESGIKIKSLSGEGCITESYQPIPFGLSLNEYGQCALAMNHSSSFEEMNEEGALLSSGLFLKNHSLPLLIPSLASLGLESFDPNVKGEYNLYLRCQDKSGNANENEYIINFCVKQGNDSTPPSIIDRDPYLETVRYDQTEINASVLTSEPAECKWDVSDKSYSAMANNLSCNTEFEDRTSLATLSQSGWKCSTIFNFAKGKNETTFYIKCKDQPWLTGENASKRNENAQSYQFKIKRAINPLEIEEINVANKTLTYSSEPASVSVEFKTSGGLDGTSRCWYTYGQNSSDEFHGAWTNSHSYVFQTLFRGSIELPIVCEDVIGNKAFKTIKFNVKIDDEAPMVTRAYANSGTLNIITDESSSCYYSTSQKDQCWFDINNASEMSGSGSNVHSIEFNNAIRYYIKCKDQFNHYSGECSIIIREGSYGA